MRRRCSPRLKTTNAYMRKECQVTSSFLGNFMSRNVRLLMQTLSEQNATDSILPDVCLLRAQDSLHVFGISIPDIN